MAEALTADAWLDKQFPDQATTEVAVKPAAKADAAKEPVAPVKDAAPAKDAVAADNVTTDKPVEFDAAREDAMIALRRYGIDPGLYGSNTAAMVAAGAKLRSIQGEFDKTKTEIGELRKQSVREPERAGTAQSQAVLTPDVDLAAKAFAESIGSEELAEPLSKFGAALTAKHAQEVLGLREALKQANGMFGEYITDAIVDGMSKDFPSLSSNAAERAAVIEKARALVAGGGYESVSASRHGQMRAALTDAALLRYGKPQSQADAKQALGQPTVPGSRTVPTESLSEEQIVDAMAEAAVKNDRAEIGRLGAVLAEKRRKR